MRKGLWLSMLLIAVVLILPTACKAPAEPAKFDVTSLDVSPPEVTASETVSVVVQVKNIGGSEGIYTATLTVDGVKAETKEVTVAPGATEKLTFSLFKDKAGTYQVAVGGLRSSFIVKEEVAKEKKILINGVIDEWSSRATTISDPCGDVADYAKSKKGVDLKTVYALMDETYLYVAIEICDVFEPSLLRNYFVCLDFDSKDPAYHWGDFGIRPSGDTWLLRFDPTGTQSKIRMEDTHGVKAYGEKNIIEIAIPRAYYKIPSSVDMYCRVTEGGPDVDQTKWFEVSLSQGK